MKKKLLITACSLEVGGIERSLVGLLATLDYTQYDVDVLLFSCKGELLDLVPPQCRILPEIPQCASMLKSVRTVLRERHFLLAWARIYTHLAMRMKYRNTDLHPDALVFAQLQAYWDRSIRFMPKLSDEYDVAISFMWPHHFVAKNVKAKAKFAWIHTDYTKAELNHEKDAAVWSAFDRIAAVSDECGEAFLQVYPQFRDRIVTVENILPKSFVETSAVAFVPQEMQGEGYTLLTVGRFCHAKAFDRVVRVCRLLKDRDVPVRWFVVGFGSDEESVRALAKELDVEDMFIFLGKKTNPYPYMAACDLYVQPSRYEGKAVTVREAQMLARPVLITDFTTARSQVRDGFDALIVPQDEESIADAVERMLSDEALRQKLSDNTKQCDYANASEVEKITRMIEECV